MHPKNVGRCSVQWIKDSYQHWLGNPNFGEQVLLLLSLPLSYCDHFQCHMSHHPPLLGSWMFWGGQGLNNPYLQIQPINMDHLPFNIVKWFMCNLSKQHLFNKLEQFLIEYCSVIGAENFHCHLSQSNTKPKTIPSRVSCVFLCFKQVACFNFLNSPWWFYLCSDNSCNYFGFVFSLSKTALYGKQC